MQAFVTGVTAGFGLAIARILIRNGHQVVGSGRRTDRLEALAAELGPSFFPVTLDVRDKTAVQSCIEHLPPACAEIDLLVNNAGLAVGLEPAQVADLDDWERMVDTNIKGLLYCTRLLLPGMVARNRGHVINIGSVAAEFPYPGGNAYGATKAFVQQFSLNLRADLLGTPIRVTDIQPGLCGGTEFSEVRYKGDTEAAAKVYAGTTPLSADDVAETVYWIATRPAHVNINTIQMMPVCQAFAPFAIYRGQTLG
jgi:3-hydroxy acid dehydrogenase / malonic semialdehyde reductase